MLRGYFPNDRKLTNKRVMELYHQFGPEAFNLSDQGYLSRVHPLELWTLNYLKHHPEAKWPEVVEASQPTRQEVYTWLFRTRYKGARDSRIRTMLELDAFADLQKRWQRLGYPFEQLVPSLATAIGSSGDRPEALAELEAQLRADSLAVGHAGSCDGRVSSASTSMRPACSGEM
jgi:hypothetical protein